MRKIFFLLVLLSICSLTRAQIRDILRNAKARAVVKVQEKVDEKVDKTIDSLSQKKLKKKAKESQTENPGNPGDVNVTMTTTENPEGQNNLDSSNQSVEQTSFVSYTKFDFVPGIEIKVLENFADDAMGDFPDHWNTNSTGAIVTIDGLDGKYLMLDKEGVYHPETINSLPDNFTLEFELLCTKEFSFYSTPLFVDIAELKNMNNFTDWKRFMTANRNGIEIMFHPTNAGSNAGSTEYAVYENGTATLKNQIYTGQFHALTNNYAKISISRQKQRIRVYINEEKVWDVPRALPATIHYNSILFALGTSMYVADRYFIGNIRFAVGAPDTRNKLVTDGKFITRGIQFDVNSDGIKPESYGTLKDIASVLTENTDMKVKIVGHTDSDGDDQSNMDLSTRRAEAVKGILARDFSIDPTRMTTEGKGESEPLDKNPTVEGKANNRRVEFIKL